VKNTEQKGGRTRPYIYIYVYIFFFTSLESIVLVLTTSLKVFGTSLFQMVGWVTKSWVLWCQSKHTRQGSNLSIYD